MTEIIFSTDCSKIPFSAIKSSLYSKRSSIGWNFNRLKPVKLFLNFFEGLVQSDRKLYLVVFFVLTGSNHSISLISQKLVSCFTAFDFIYMYYAYILCLMLSFLLFVMSPWIYAACYVFLAWRLVLFHVIYGVHASFFDIRLYGKMPKFVF